LGNLLDPDRAARNIAILSLGFIINVYYIKT